MGRELGLPEVSEQARELQGQRSADMLRRRPEAELTAGALLRILMRIEGKIEGSKTGAGSRGQYLVSTQEVEALLPREHHHG